MSKERIKQLVQEIDEQMQADYDGMIAEGGASLKRRCELAREIQKLRNLREEVLSFGTT